MNAKNLLALKDELKRDLEAIERVERMMTFKNIPIESKPEPVPERLTASQTIAEAPQAMAEEIEDDLDSDANPNSLRGTIEQIINTHPDVRWTTQRILAHLSKINYPLKAQKPIYSVGQALRQLTVKRRIKLARKGAGSEPNIYRALSTTPSQEDSSGQGLFMAN